MESASSAVSSTLHNDAKVANRQVFTARVEPVSPVWKAGTFAARPRAHFSQESRGGTEHFAIRFPGSSLYSEC
jgi:hypothetical protein